MILNACREIDQDRPSCLDNSLRCLRHPSVAISIVLLVVNDHVLKQSFPGVVTNKLSDFSGLYFFPFLIAVGLGFVLGNSAQRRKDAGVLAFLFAGAFFVLIKTVPWINSLTEESLSILTGRRSIIVLDTTDLVALLVLYPSWRLWKRPANQKSSYISWLVIGIASLASIATSIVEPSVITNLYVQGDTVYAAAPSQLAWFESNDDGQTWQYLSEVPSLLSNLPNRDPMLPKTSCDPDDESWCIKVSGEEFVEHSYDSGVTWTVAWKVPSGRRMFMERLTTGLFGSKQIDVGPYDVVFAGNPNNRRAVIAMGNEGILLIDLEGKWSRVQVGGDSYPTPFEVREMDEIIRLVGWETIFILVAAVTGWALLNNLFWQPILEEMKSRPALSQLVRWVTKPLDVARIILFTLLASAIIIGLITNLFFVGLFLIWPLLVSVLFALTIPFVGQFVSRNRLAQVASNSPWPVRGLWSVFLVIAAFLIFGYTPLVLWAWGTIPWYGIAILISVILMVTVFALGLRRVRKYAVKTIENLS